MTVIAIMHMVLGCGPAAAPTAGVKLEARKDLAVCVFPAGGKTVYIGQMYGGNVELFDKFGGQGITFFELTKAISAIADPVFNEEIAIRNAILAHGLPGIWKAERAVIGGQKVTARHDDPGYLILRADRTFRVVRRGLKHSGNWELNSTSQLLLKVSDADATIAEVKSLRGGYMELTTTEDGEVVTVKYYRTRLKTEPEAADE